MTGLPTRVERRGEGVRNYLRTQWWIAVFPGMTITLVVLILNIIGDALRDALDPNVRA